MIHVRSQLGFVERDLGNSDAAFEQFSEAESLSRQALGPDADATSILEDEVVDLTDQLQSSDGVVSDVPMTREWHGSQVRVEPALFSGPTD